MTENTPKNPKVFISYSWTNEEFKQLVLTWSERLAGDGINVILDRWELKEGSAPGHSHAQ